MKATVILSIWAGSFVLSATLLESLNLFFWLSFSVFAGACIYIERNQKRLSKEIDELFDFQDDEFK